MKETLVPMFLAGVRFWHFFELESDCCTSRHICAKNIYIYFGCVGVRILVEK